MSMLAIDRIFDMMTFERDYLEAQFKNETVNEERLQAIKEEYVVKNENLESD